MTIDHVAIWTYNLEGMRNFYMHYFDASSWHAYYNHSKEFRSYFLSFNGTCKLEIMEMPNVPQNKNNTLKQYTGLIHFAFNPAILCLISTADLIAANTGSANSTGAPKNAKTPSPVS
jgi:hypothetical protein